MNAPRPDTAAPLTVPEAEQPALSKPIRQPSVYDGEIGSEDMQLRFEQDDLIKGLIYSEILAPPKSRRTGR